LRSHGKFGGAVTGDQRIDTLNAWTPSSRGCARRMPIRNGLRLLFHRCRYGLLS
jgi:hypothetical protein